ncbi:MAG TPA: MoaD/ThiS family protein [Jatrophihabitans sp.]|jgi:molybdopterin converting factor small subunit
MPATASQTVTVLVPRTLMAEIDGQRIIEVPVAAGATLADLLDALATDHPVFDRRLRDETRALRRYVNVYVDGDDVRQLGGVAASVKPGQEVQIIQSVAGG